ncbi:MAG: DUF4258 domain-containing protein [Anaerolineales bacterium]|nr:MAG: DUF4258 domain-containing protein [Anaerolineales bacterium]
MTEHLDSDSKPHTNQWEDLFVGREELRVSDHALREAHKEGLRGRDIIYIILTGTVVERYPDRRRVLIAGIHKNNGLPIHIVCDYTDVKIVVVVTVYIPNRFRWAHPLRRRTSTSSKLLPQ